LNPSVACVVPTHKRHDFLSESLDSLLSQTYPLTEIIVVSDVEDPTAEEICLNLSSRLDAPRIKFVHDPSAGNGASASRNRGASETEAQYVAFLDDDDLWKPTLLEEAVQKFEDTGTDMVVVCREIFSEYKCHPGPPMIEGLGASDVAAMSMGTTGSNMILTRDAFKAINGFDADLPVKNDSDFFFRFLLQGFSYSVVPSVLVRQRKHGLGQLTSKNERRALGTEAYIKKHRTHLQRDDLRQLRLSIHRIRRASATNFFPRTYHLLAAIYYYRYSDYVKERQEKHIWDH